MDFSEFSEFSVFSWPDNKRAALSITFDDARPSQLDRGIPILDRYGVKGTFYVSIGAFRARLDDWRRAADRGHEIGNHTVNHPCSGNFQFARKYPLEDYTLERMEDEFLGASEAIAALTGDWPSTFAYPCGQKYVGRASEAHSYVPLVAQHFVAGRGYRDESANAPDFCDLSQLMGIEADNQSWEQLKPWLDRALENGEWVIFAGHEVGKPGHQTVREDALAALCEFAADEDNGLWVDTVANISAHISHSR